MSAWLSGCIAKGSETLTATSVEMITKFVGSLLGLEYVV